MAAPIDIAAIIDEHAIGRFQFKIALLCGLIQVLDGFDGQAMSYAAPALAQAWHLERSMLGPVFSASLVGIFLGTLFISQLADRFGRRPLLITAMLAIAVFTFLTAFADSVLELVALRLLTGIGLGASLPNTFVMATEFAPRRRRTTLVMLMACGFALGAAVGGQVTAGLLPRFGWSAVFYVGGILPALLTLALWVWLPESIRLLAARPGRAAEIARILGEIDPKLAIPADATFRIRSDEPGRGRLVQLFTEGRAAMTLLLWGAFFMNFLTLNFLNSWLPTLINSAGLPVQEAVRITTLFQIGGIAGIVGMGLLVDRFGFFKVLGTSFTLATLLTVLMGFVGASALALAPAVTAAGLCVLGEQNTLFAFSAAVYPTPIRSTGASTAMGIGRIGSIVGPLIGSVLISLSWPLSVLFYVSALPTLCGIVIVLAMIQVQSKAQGNKPVVALGRHASTP
jgi:AAHS family 4-hydroxybenzoate transporter-like MFS transporter